MHIAGETIAAGVARIEVRTPTLPPATHTNSYALGGREMVLVEPATPYEDEQREWLNWARALLSQGRRAQAVLLTHHHPDHIGGAELLARELSLPTWAHPETASRVPVRVDRLLHDGDTLTLDGPAPQQWRCLHTPGHAPGHLCFVEEALSVAVVGDMVASVGTIVVDPFEGDMRAYLAQLERLDGLGLATALPAHGAPIETPSALFRHYIKHRLGREAKVLAAVEQLTGAVASDAAIDAETAGGASLDELVPLAYADTPPAIWPLAKMSLWAHLIKLARDGRVEQPSEGMWRVLDAPSPSAS